MSDSDDTDILLLIPPNYFMQSAEQKLQREKMNLREVADALAMPPPHNPPPTTAAYKFLPPSRKAELNVINAHLHDLEVNNDGCQFGPPSDISTISTNTVRTQLGNRIPRVSQGIVHSTPKGNSVVASNANRKCRATTAVDDGILLEIDNFLDDGRNCDAYKWQRHSDDYRRESQAQFENVESREPQTSSLPSELNRITMCTTRPPAENKLISLSEIWGKNGHATTIAAASTQTQLSLQEEQLRRQHLEKTVYTLQTQLLECQQRISVAIEVDRTKDAAIETTQQECKSLNTEVKKLRDSLDQLEYERQNFNSRTDSLQKELAQAVSLATKFQEKNDKLESDVASFTRKSNEATNVHKQQLEELELKVHGSKRAEEFALNELQKFKDKCAKVEYQNEKHKSRTEELEKESITLKHQKEMLQEFHQKQKSRADALETQKKSLHEALANLTETETTLKKKLDTQQKTLKSHYQQQLETVVTQKLKEFQEQLDKTEETLKAEARERERLIAERAVKQLEMINEKNELELNLLQEKHNEEVELYRLQLANASKKIDDLDLKLNCYKSKRADIAQKLHNVMEIQWQKALEILTSPNQTGSAETDTDVESPDNNEQHHYETTPKTSKSKRKSSSTKENNLDVASKKDPPSPMDKLQAYIELLLSKSPSDFDKLDEILALTSKNKTTTSKLDKSSKRSAHIKPPWKA